MSIHVILHDLCQDFVAKSAVGILHCLRDKGHEQRIGLD